MWTRIRTKKEVVIGVCCIMSFTLSYGNQKTKTQITESPPTAYMYNTIYSYMNFHFKSQTQESLNRFDGHSNLYALGGNVIKTKKNFVAGLFIYRLDTQVNSNLILPSLPEIRNKQRIHTNSLFINLLKPIKPYLFIDVVGGYGQNCLNSETLVNVNTENEEHGYAHGYSHNWFASIVGLYNYSQKYVVFNSNINLLHSEINQKQFAFNFNPSLITTRVPQLINKATFLFENAEIGYKLNDQAYSFIDVGLIQVLQFSNSRPVIGGSSPIIGSLPEFNLNKNGYKLGGGISFKYNKITFRVEQQYTQRSSLYHNNQSILSLTLRT